MKVDRSSISVAPSDPLYSLSLTISKTAVIASAVANSNSNNRNVRESSSSAAAADISRMSLDLTKKRLNDDASYDDNDEKFKGETDDYPLQEMSETVGGVWMPRIGWSMHLSHYLCNYLPLHLICPMSFCKPLTLSSLSSILSFYHSFIHSFFIYFFLGGGGAWGGVLAPPGNNSSAMKDKSAYPALATSASMSNSVVPVSTSAVGARTGTNQAVQGSSSVGGWGFDKGTVWHPVSLPSAAATAAASSRQKISSGERLETREETRCEEKRRDGKSR